jgi:hypothetical protein
MFSILGSKDNVQDNVSARLNKTALAIYRIAAFCGLLEAAYDMVSVYIDEFVSFNNGEADDLFFQRSSKIAEQMYGPILRKEERFIISTDVCKRAQNVNVQNLAQYLALMKISTEDKKRWINSSGKTMRSSMGFSITNQNELDELTDISRNSIDVQGKSQLPLSRKQLNILKKTNNHKASILLHPSLLFLKSGLYINSCLKKASSLINSQAIS